MARLFQELSYLQLGLVALLAPVFTAGAITQEKDSQTYDILLATPLTNGQIVLGSLLSRIFFVVALLVSGIPIFSITQIFGGVAIRSIVLSFAIAAATTLVTGALAMAIATFKVGTRRTIFSFYLFIVIYLIGGMLLDRAPFTHPVLGIERDSTGQVVTDAMGSPKVIRAKTSYFTGINPFLALRVLFHEQQYTPPDLGSLPESMKGWPERWYLTSPETFYPWLMTVLSLVMILPSIVLLRRLAQSTTNFRAVILQSLHLSRGDRTRKPRAVWSNPIAWREAKTKASAARATILRMLFILGGLAVAIAVLVMFSRQKLEGRYISSTSYNATDGTLTIYNGESAMTYRLRPGAKISILRPGGPVDADSNDILYGRMAVDTVTVGAAGIAGDHRADAQGDSAAAGGIGDTELFAGGDHRRVCGDPADRHQCGGQHCHAGEGRRLAGYSALDADHQPVLHLGEAARAGELCAAAGGGAGGERALVYSVRPLAVPRLGRGADVPMGGLPGGDFDHAADADHRDGVCEHSGDADVAALPDDGAGGDELRGDRAGGVRGAWGGAGTRCWPAVARARPRWRSGRSARSPC